MAVIAYDDRIARDFLVKTFVGGLGPADSHHSAIVANVMLEVSMEQQFAKLLEAESALLASR